MENKQNKKMKDVAIYVRVSTDKQEVQNQIDQLRAYCEKNNLNVFHEYVDVISGKEKSRPNFDLLFLHARHNHFHLVLFWDISRFSRSGTLYTLQRLKELDNLGIEWVSYREPYFNTAGEFKDVIISIMSTLAKMERGRISERTKAGLKRAKNVGKRGKDKKPRIIRSDRGIKRGVKKTNLDYLNELRNKDGRF